MAKYLETKYTKKAGSQGGGKFAPAQTFKGTPHGRNTMANKPDNMPGRCGTIGNGKKGC